MCFPSCGEKKRRKESNLELFLAEQSSPLWEGNSFKLGLCCKGFNWTGWPLKLISNLNYYMTMKMDSSALVCESDAVINLRSRNKYFIRVPTRCFPSWKWNHFAEKPHADRKQSTKCLETSALLSINLTAFSCSLLSETRAFEKLLTLSEWGKKRSTHRERCRQVHWLVELLSLSEISMGARKAQIRGIKFYPALHFQTCASSGLGCIACDGGSRLWYIIPKGEGIQRVYHCCWKMHTSTDWKT